MGENNEMSLREQIAAGFGDLQEEPTQPVEETTGAEVQEQPVEGEQVSQPVEETGAENAPTAQAVEQPTEQVTTQSVDTSAQLMEIVRQQQAMIQQMQQQMQQQQSAMQQQSQLAEETVNQTMAEPEPYPQFDFDAVRYLDSAAQQQAMMEWQKAVMERASKDAVTQVMGEMQPIREQYETNRRIAEDDAARTAVFGDPRFSDFGDRREYIERVIANTPALQGASPTDKWVIGGLMDRGMRHQNAPSTQEIVEMAKANPEVMKTLMASQATEVANTQAGLPKISASAGMAQAQAIPENRPTNVKELGNALRRGLMR